MRRLLLTLVSLSVTLSAGAQGLVELPNRVGAGDVSQTGAVLWGRVGEPGTVTFWYLRLGQPAVGWQSQSVVVTDPAVPAKVNLTGLSAGRTYLYLVQVPSSDLDVGVFRTSHPPGARRGLRFGVSGDSRGELAPYPAVGNAPSRNLDFFVTLGDTIYADVSSPALPKSQAETLEEFRVKHDEVLSEHLGVNPIGSLRSLAAQFAVIDDHEVTNDFAGGAHPSSDPRFAGQSGDFINETELFGNGLKAFHDYQPIRELFYGATGDPRTAGKRNLYRARAFGSDAAIFLLDARSFRDEPLDDVTNPFDPVQVGQFLIDSFDPSRTMLGKAQIERLEADLLAAQALGITWKFVMVPEPVQNLGVLFASDRFEGYSAERTRILSFIRSRGIKNVVFVAADFHGTLINNLSYRTEPFGPNVGVDAFEIVTGPIAYDAPFGPTVVEAAFQLGLIDQAVKDFYDGLSRPLKEVLLKILLDAVVGLYGYDSLGLTGSSIQAELLSGGYTATHVYGWTEFAIDAATQRLTVTVYGIDPYTKDDLAENPAGVLARTPAVVSRFVVVPK